MRETRSRDSAPPSEEAASDVKQGNLAEALRAASEDPERDEAWDEVERIAAAHQRPTDVAELYKHVLGRELPKAVAVSIGDRAAQFLAEWYEEPTPQIEVLRRVLEIDPTVTWPFERLSVLYTNAERWSELLTLYEYVLPHADAARRLVLLNEAAHVAKDFAGNGPRAIDYFEQLFALRPTDVSIATSLERLLEREKRHEDLIRFWEARLEQMAPDVAQQTRVRMATCWLDHLRNPAPALELAVPLLEDAVTMDVASQLVERVLSFGSSSDDVRERALDALKRHYGRTGRSSEIVRVLETALGFAEGDARAVLHREIGVRLRRQRQLPEAVEHYAALLVLTCRSTAGAREGRAARVPTRAAAKAKLWRLAERTWRYEEYSDALASAADALAGDDAEFAIALLTEAGDVRRDRLGDAPGAADLYEGVLERHDADDATILAVGRKLRALLEDEQRLATIPPPPPAEHAGGGSIPPPRRARLLEVLERLVALEPDGRERREAIAQAAHLAADLGELDRAFGLWRKRVEADAQDKQALDAIVELLERAERFEELVAALRDRAASYGRQDAVDPARRRDLVRVARLYVQRLAKIPEAIEAWLDVERAFGSEPETVDALSELLAREERYGELADLLARAIAADEGDGVEDRGRRVALCHQLGEIHRTKLGAPDQALAFHRRAVALEPGCEPARSGLEALLGEPSCRGEAVGVLVEAFGRTDDWARVAAIVEHRLAVAADDAARSRILVETAGLHEQRGGDRTKALTAIARALVLTPSAVDVEAELVRLADTTDSWHVAATAYRDAARAVREGPRAIELLARRGEILEARLGDLPAALDAFRDRLGRAPDDRDAADAVTRVAGRLGLWDVAARAVVGSAVARGAIDAAPVPTFATVASENGAWDEATGVMAAAIAEEVSLPAQLARDLEMQLAMWHRDERGDADAAEAALARAHERSGPSADSLRMLADLQRRAPGRPLVDTLLALAATGDGSIDALYEAAEVTMGVLGDPELARTILEKVLADAANRWVSADGSDLPRLEWFASWALDHLVRAAIGDNDYVRAIELLVEGAWLPFIKEKARGMIHQAAAIAANDLKDPDRAIELYRSLIERAPDDAPAIERLVDLYETTNRLSDLLELRKHELSLVPPLEQRLELRLEMAELHGRLQNEDARIAVLHENLGERPGHGATIGQLGRVLEAQGRHGELADLLADQARALESSGDTPDDGAERPGDGSGSGRTAARDLWVRVADAAEYRLNDLRRALDAHKRAVDIAPSTSSLDALARLHAELGEHGEAVACLEHRLAITEVSAAQPIVARLASAHAAAGETERARTVLERALEADRDAHALREQLRELYRSVEAWEPLVALLREGAERVGDDAAKVAFYREAGEVLHTRLERPEAAIDPLRSATALDPSDRPTRMRLADALRTTGQVEEAGELLAALIDDYGRRRPRDRAEAHYQLALCARARGDAKEASKQLELAGGMDVEHGGVFQALAEVYRDAGELERAERAYRTLLLLVLRGTASGAPASAGGPLGAHGVGRPALATPSAIFLELYRIAKRLGREDRAAEVLESAFEAAGQSDDEGRRFEQALRAVGEQALLLRALESRLERASDAAERALIVAEIADVLERIPGREADALDARLAALRGAPDRDGLHASALAAARRARTVDRYTRALAELAEDAESDRRGELAATLFARLGAVIDEDLRDPAHAREMYERAEAASGDAPLDLRLSIWRAIERLAGIMGDARGQARALRAILFSGDDIEGTQQNEGLYRLAEMELASPQTAEQGLESLETALDRDPQHDRALAMLRRAAALVTPDDALDDAPRHASALLAAYERVARAAEDGEALLDALERLARLPDAVVEPLAEAVELATSLGREGAAEALLLRAVEIARRGELSAASWALVALADRHEAKRDLAGAARFLEEAASVAEATDAQRLLVRLATMAAGPLGDFPLAARIYDALLEREPGDRAVWEPLLDVHRKMGNPDALEAKLGVVADGVYDAEERSRLRLERARLLLARPDRAERSIEVLQQILDEDPDHAEAASMLIEVCERTGEDGALVELLTRQLDAAQTRNDADEVVALSLRIAKALKRSKPREAADVIRSAVEWAPDPRPLLEVLLETIGGDGDPIDRADVLERLLAIETGDRAVERAFALATARVALDDEVGAERALETGLRIVPKNAKLRARLAAHYADHERWARLAELKLQEAGEVDSPDGDVALFREAAGIYRDRLGNAAAAAQALRQALEQHPDDIDLVVECARCLEKAGEYELAAEDVTAALERLGADRHERTDLLRLRAELRTAAGQDALAIEDLEEAFSITSTSTSWPGAPIAPDLAAALERRRSTAADSGDRDAERASTLRLVELHTQAGDPRAARSLLSAWAEKAPEDAHVQRQLLDIEAAEGRWEAVAQIAARLVAVEPGERKVESALRLAEAWQALGHPENAREGLEAAMREAPGEGRIRGLLLRIYEDIGAHRELAQLCAEEARIAQGDDVKFQLVRRAGELWLNVVGDAAAAMEALEEARRLRPADHDVVLLLADAYTSAGYLAEAAALLLDAAIAAHKGRRSPQLAFLQHRMARVAAASGDRHVESAWLNAALDSDSKNADVAAELADVATEIGQLDVALKALRAVSLVKSERIPRALAYLRQGMIHYEQGDQKRAVMMAKRAQAEDALLVEAGEFLARINRG